jgi:hypothetical protein
MTKLIGTYSGALIAEKKAKEDKAQAQAEIYRLIGDAERVIHPKYSVWAGVVGPAHIEAHDRDGYRGFKVTHKKEKAVAKN